MLNNPFWEEILPDVCPGPPLAEFHAVPSHPVAIYLGEEVSSHPAIPSLLLGSCRGCPRLNFTPPFLASPPPLPP